LTGPLGWIFATARFPAIWRGISFCLSSRMVGTRINQRHRTASLPGGQGIKFTDGLALLWAFLFFKWRETKVAAMARRSARFKVPSFEELPCPRMSKVANSASTLDQRGGGEFMRCGSKSVCHSVCHLLFQDSLTREPGHVLSMFHARDLLPAALFYKSDPIESSIGLCQIYAGV
jgi:hypothetical protein